MDSQPRRSLRLSRRAARGWTQRPQTHGVWCSARASWPPLPTRKHSAIPRPWRAMVPAASDTTPRDEATTHLSREALG
jgi:hypothetical protein